jgi:PleD family two-component response regulator
MTERKKILLVDDSATTLFMEEMLLSRDYDLVKAQNGEEALNAAVDHRPDLILLDVIMPGMTGFDVCRHLREKETTSAIPVIMVTTRGEASNMERGFVEGCTDYITKPIDSIELVSKVRNCLAVG